jgi:ribokinase
MSQIDVLSVGDIVTDAFIRLREDQAVSFENDHGKWIAMPFGQKIPFDHAEIVEAVGNSPNAAVSFAKLGLQSSLYVNIGDDQHGRDMLTSLHNSGVDTRLVRVNPGKNSNYHYILWYKDERTILIKHEEFDYHWPHLRPDEIPSWIYFSSIAKNALPFHDDLATWLEENPLVKFAFQPGTFQIDFGAERLKRLYQRAEVLLVNREEATEISEGDHENISELVTKLHDMGPSIVVVTDGPKGAYASDGQQMLFMPPYPDPKPPYERTGAGDAFSSAFVAALIKGNNIEGALQWAPINSMNVVQSVGAQKGLLSEKEISELLVKAPASYKPERLA